MTLTDMISRAHLKYFRWLLLSLVMVGTVQAKPSDYLLGTGDVVKISVYQYQDLTTETRVSESGVITFPLIGEVTIGGETTADAEKKIAKRLEQGGFIKEPQVNIEIVQFHGQEISVLGQVNRPGKYPIQKASKVTDLLAMAGGVAEMGGDQIVLLRPTATGIKRYELNSLRLFQQGDASQDMEVENGDIIYVPRMPKFYIYGEVQRPGFYRLEDNMTVMQALAVGGGLTLRGTLRGIEVVHHNADGRAVTREVRLTDKLQDNDVVYVGEALF